MKAVDDGMGVMAGGAVMVVMDVMAVMDMMATIVVVDVFDVSVTHRTLPKTVYYTHAWSALSCVKLSCMHMHHVPE